MHVLSLFHPTLYLNNLSLLQACEVCTVFINRLDFIFRTLSIYRKIEEIMQISHITCSPLPHTHSFSYCEHLTLVTYTCYNSELISKYYY